MQLFIKIILSLAIILVATGIGRKLPSAAGLVSVMPLTGLLVLVWMYIENRGNPAVMQQFTKGAIWGILPTILFFLTAYVCFKKHLSLPVTLLAGFAVWLGGAVVHQLLLK